MPEFTRRRLIRTDRPAAISGIATHIQASQPGRTYVLRLWRETLFDDLLWTCAGTHLARSIPDDSDISGSSASLASSYPSWSWLSLDGPVSYLPGFQSPTCMCIFLSNAYYECHYFYGKLTTLFEDLCKLLNPETLDRKYCWNDPLNRSYNLHLRGRMMPCLIEWDGTQRIINDFRFSKTQQSLLRKIHPTSQQAGVGVWIDNNFSGSMIICYVLEILSSVARDGQRWGGLLLSRSPNQAHPRVFKRAGVLTWEKQSEDDVLAGAVIANLFETDSEELDVILV